ncbi:DUF2934 domain-containing protein [Sulfurirhabdus autotrophica]|uniref:DUF2934 family protein n=1 Tax=Sulfurirhabdus autotrophica TaxID=1706046 RepID=A0A4R3YE92_9PROT|nr:DUF2934 domain-containing protein [Sulfurirhabdus autotrophica]TCV90396.1 DUF2934 family protein [Sulfurirhabdus autotrophica]
MSEVKSKSRSKSNNSSPTSKTNISSKSKQASSAAQITNSVTPEERYHMIAEAAYFRAESRGFVSGDPSHDWFEAEAEIERILQHQNSESNGGNKQAFQSKLEAQLKEWDAKLAELKEKALETTAEIREDYEKQLQILSGKRAVAHAKMQELSQRTEDAWEDLKGGTEKAWDEMRKALNQIASRFK